MSKKRHFIILTHIDRTVLHENYGILHQDIGGKQPNGNNLKQETIHSTKISDLQRDNISYINQQTKQLNKCNVSTVDLNSSKPCNLLKYNCFWCRHPFSNDAIGCPIAIENNKMLKKYTSAINNVEYNIVDELPLSKIPNNDQHMIYTTDGVFCSFNCCVSYINDNKKDNNLYDNSYSLLLRLYRDMTNVPVNKIQPAPHWRLLERYGGHLSISQFRDEMDIVKYCDKGMLRHHIIFNPVTWIYDKKIQI